LKQHYFCLQPLSAKGCREFYAIFSRTIIIKYLKKNKETDTYRFKKGNNKNEVYKKGED
jgi:hypothetical protein